MVSQIPEGHERRLSKKVENLDKISLSLIDIGYMMTQKK